MAAYVWDLVLSGLLLNQAPFYLTNETELLSWPQPVSTTVARANRAGLRTGASWSDSLPVMKMQIAVLGETRDHTADALRNLRVRLLPPNNGTFPLLDRTRGVVLSQCFVSSDIDVEWRFGSQAAIVTFTLTSLQPFWRATDAREYSGSLDGASQVTFTANTLGDAPVGDAHIIFACSSASRPTMRSASTATEVSLDLGSVSIPPGSTYFYRVSLGTFEAYRVPTASWGAAAVSGGSVTHLLSQSWPGFTIQRRASAASDILYISGCDSWMLLFQDAFSVVA